MTFPSRIRRMYPYHLGCHLKTGRLCRIPHPDLGVGIPVGFVRIVRYKERLGTHINRYTSKPYEPNGELKPYYWSIPRWSDIQRELGEERTGPIMFQLFSSIEEVEGY